MFIIGVTILATEYEWASRFRDFALKKIRQFGQWYKENKVLGTLIGLIFMGLAIGSGYFVYSKAL